MLLFKKHGRRAEGTPRSGMTDLTASQTCGFTNHNFGGLAPNCGAFDYFFRSAPEMADAANTTEHLDALADAMVSQSPTSKENSQIPPIFTYLGQFIDHDVTANTDAETAFSKVDVDRVIPAPRADVAEMVKNLRMGALNLDSVYGGGVAQGPLAKKLAAALRFPGDCAKLWVGTDIDAGFGTIKLPEDPARDLLRIGRLLRAPHQQITKDELRALPKGMREMFVNADESIRVQRAVIGDSRNDENLAVAQLHLAFVRLHNQIVDEAHLHGIDTTDRDTVFDWARKMTIWHYQWLVLHVFLPTICDPAVVKQVLADGAPVYGAFFDAVGQPAPGLMPMPLEFSVAAFRYGHSMIRDEYDWNTFFGEDPPENFPNRATLLQLFEFTGGAAQPMPVPGQGSAPRLPSHWPIEWDRFALPVDAKTFPDRAARKIDANLAMDLGNLPNEEQGSQVLRHLARRNLRRGHRLNIPSAQGCLKSLKDTHGIDMPVLGEEHLLSGHTGDAVETGQFHEDTPLWFYILKEAEITADGESLGPLGSRLVAETLAGLILHDPMSFWNQAGPDWSPADGVTPDGVVIDSMPAMLRAAAVL